MNYVIINGKKSTTINGLLIQSLPPISKPQMRTQTEEIDGKDGDIITPLGYSAYDKQIQIGLYGEYDINEVIAYFNGSGIVTFSNEHDKYYYFTIVKAIDYERLIRFKTATVTFHVQPFKYSLVEQALNFTFDTLLSFKDFSQTKNGVTVSAENGVISVSGTATSATEIYMPINKLYLETGEYTLNADSSGSGVSNCSIRLINDSPAKVNSFGGTYVTLQNEQTVSINAELETAKTYNYLYFYITAGTMNFETDINVVSDDNPTIKITNTGNTTAKPKITIYATSDISVELNGMQVLQIALGSEGYITIDSAEMEAYKDGILKNRLVTGDYDDLYLKVGVNTLVLSGDIENVIIENYSRWL